MTLVLYGPPGSGKTTRLLRELHERMERDKLAPEETAFVSYSRNAVQEMISRAGFDPMRTPHWKTIHALALSVTGHRDRRVADGYAVRRFVREHTAFHDAPLAHEIETAITLGSLAEARCEPITVTYQRFGAHTTYGEAAMVRWWTAWRTWCRESSLVRFGDMLHDAVHTPTTLWRDVRLVVVDEAADTSRAQLAVLQHLIPPRADIVVAGDDDQAIYEGLGAMGWDAMRTWPDVTEEVLSHTWRLPDRLMHAAGRVIRRVPRRRFKPCTPRARDAGLLTHVAHAQDIVLPAEGSVLLLTRRTRLLGLLRRVVQDAALPYQDHSGEWTYAHSLVQAAVAWTRLQRGRSVDADTVSALRAHVDPAVWQIPRGMAGLAPSDVPEAARARPWYHVCTHDTSREHLAYVRGMLERVQGSVRTLQRDARIRVTTIHDAKGTEADHVFLLNSRGRRITRAMRTDADVHDAETRVTYVGATRARHSLTTVTFSLDT